MAFTAQLGTSLSQPGNIALGGGIFNPAIQVYLIPAALTFQGTVHTAYAGQLLYQGAVTVIAQRRKTFKAKSRPPANLQSRFQPLKVVQRTTTQLDSVPPEVDIAVTETYPYQVDVTQYLISGDTISSISAILTLASTGAVIPGILWQGTISTAGNIIQVPIVGGGLRLGQTYQLATTFTANTNKTLTILSTVNIVA